MRLLLPRLYAITDTRLSRMTHAEQVESLARGGATFIQLRDKTSSPGDFYADALNAVEIGHRLGARILINDRVDIALAVGADGVHLGQGDLPAEEARMLLGPDRIVGFSTHTLDEALKANSDPVDYIAIGPLFHTSTKENPHPVLGLKVLEELNGRLARPLVAIGGITLATVRSVIDAGADSAAVISDLVGRGNPGGRVADYLACISK